MKQVTVPAAELGMGLAAAATAYTSPVQGTRTLADGPGGNTETLIVAAHADDVEVMLGGAVRTEVAAGNTVHVAYGTRAEGSTRNARWWRPSFVRTGGRVHEARRGARRMGVDPDNIHQYDFGDGKLERNLDEFAVALHGIIAARRGITRLITTGASGYDGHPDHIAAHHAALRAIGRLSDSRRADMRLQHLDAQSKGEMVLAVDRRRKQWDTIAHFSQFPGIGFRFFGHTALILPPMTREYMDSYAPLFEAETYWLETGNEIV